MRRKLLAGLAIAASGLATPVVMGQSSTPATPPLSSESGNKVLTEVKTGAPKELIYELEAKAYLFIIPVTGRADFNVKLNGDTYTMDTRVKTTGIADIFVDYDMRVASSGYVKENDLQTYNYVSQNNDGKKNRRVEMTYGADDVEMIATPAFGNLGFPPATPEQKLKALDPITSLVDIMFQERNADEPCGDPLTIFDGRQLTRLSLNYVGPADIKTKAWKGKGIECHVNMERVAGYKKGEKGSNLSGIDGPMSIYFGEALDGMMVPVKIVVDTEDIGRITVQTSKIALRDIVSTTASADTNSAG